MFNITGKGNFEKTFAFLDYIKEKKYKPILQRYAEKGVAALKAATPSDSGETANSWDYYIEERDNKITIYFTNDEVTNEGTPIAILIQYGHATRGGGFVMGQDFINPALRPVFEQMANEMWEKIVNVQ